MNSPFPGMDPYIESAGLWRNFHANLMIKIQDALAEEVPSHYLVRAEERSYLLLAVENGKETREFYPDVRVVEPKPGKGKQGKRRPAAAGVAQLATPTAHTPMHMSAFVEEEVRETFIDILTVEPEHRLVTTIEVLSPANKDRGSHGWNLYLRKRQATLVCGVNLVEIDLLRGGGRLPMREPWPDSPYSLLVARGAQGYRCEVWPAFFHLPLPGVPVPLLPPDPDVVVDLQPIIASIYRRLRYNDSIDYDQPLKPRPTPAERRWLKQVQK